MPWKFNPFTCSLDYYQSAPAESDPVFTAWLLATPPIYSESDPIFTTWLSTTPPLYSETDPHSIHLDQTSPKTFTAGTVTGTGLLKVTSGQLGLDTTTYSSNFKGVLASAPVSGTNGDWYIDSVTATMYVYYGTTWWAMVYFPSGPTTGILTEAGDYQTSELGEYLLQEA